MKSTTHNTGSWVPHWSERDGKRLAIVDSRRRLSWIELEERTARAAGLLDAAGVTAGDRVGIVLQNGSPYLEVLLAASRLGAIAVPINTRLSPREIAFIVDDATPRQLFVAAPFLQTVEAALAQAAHQPMALQPVGGSDDAYERALAGTTPRQRVEAVDDEHPMILMYTSGTTGAPKGALLPHRKALFNSLNAQLVFGLRRDDRVLVVSPLFHSLALQIISLPVLYSGGTLYLHDHFDPQAVWQAVHDEQLDFMGGVPTMYQQMADLLEAADGSASRWKLDSLRFCFTAGAAVSVDLIHTFERHGLVLKQGYGQTETSMLCCLEERDAIRKAGSVGQALRHMELRVVAIEGIEGSTRDWRDVSPGETGEIVVRGPITMLEYWRRPEATAETLREEGWLRTNDLARRDGEGFITLVGRARDMYISGGENVYPAEIEAVFREHPAIREIAVVGVPHPRWGETGRAHLVLEDGARIADEELTSWGRERLARFKLPQSFVVERELPKTASGKVQKHLLG